MLVSTINRYRIKFREVERPTDHHQSLTDLGAAAGVNIGNHDDSLYCQVLLLGENFASFLLVLLLLMVLVVLILMLLLLLFRVTNRTS